jgi:hypothetical protein
MRAVVGRAAVGLVILACLPGCGDGPRSRVHGKVTYLGNTVTGGTVIFLAKDNMTYVADIQADGTYSVTGVPRGPVRVSVQQPPPRPGAKSENAPRVIPKVDPEGKNSKAVFTEIPEPKTSGPRIPAVYADANQSGLSFEVKDPDQEYNIDLK